MKKVWPIVLLIISVLIILICLLTYIFFMGDKRMDKNNTNNEPIKENIDNTENVPKEDDNVDKLKKEYYFIEKNLDRYLNYLKMHPEKDMTEIVRCVNANIDYEFYTNTVNSNTDDDILLIVNKYHKLSSNYASNCI